MEFLFELLFEFFGEFLLQLLGQLLLEMGLHFFERPARNAEKPWKAPVRKPPQPWLAALGYAALGAAVGGLSLLVFPHYLMASKSLRVANAALSPILAGLSMAAVGAWRAKRGQAVLRIDKFSYGYLFALGLGLVRFWFAR